MSAEARVDPRAPRCTYCDARLMVREGRAVMPHLTWCPRRPRAAAPPPVTLLEPTPYVEPIDADEAEDQRTAGVET